MYNQQNVDMLPVFQSFAEHDRPVADKSWIVQPKLNGVAAAFWRGNFYSKTRKIFPQHRFAHLLRQILVENAPPIYGELWSPLMTLPEISGACNHYTQHGEAPLHFVYYDVQCSGGYVNRTQQWFIHMPTTATVYPISLVRADKCNDDVIDGTVYRHPNGIYLPGPARNGAIVKVKKWKELDAIVEGTVPGTGELTGKVGALRCRFRNITFTVGSGLTSIERDRYIACSPKRVKVRYLNLSSEGVPLNPVFLEELNE